MPDKPIPLLECRHITKRFGSTVAVNDVSLQFPAGQTLGLVGENGAGKTTLLSIIAGELRPDEGSIALEGQECSLGSAHEARERGIAIVHQELSLFPDLTVAENIAMGREPSAIGGFIDVRELHVAVQEVVDRLEVPIDVDRLAGTLSPSHQQLVEIAKALYWTPRVLILDEPTSSLESHEVEVLHRIIRRLNQAGTAIIFVSHRLDEVFAFAQEIAVMRDGRLVDSGPISSYTRASLPAKMVGREISQVYPERRQPPRQEEPILELRNVSAGPVRDLSLEINPGSIVGIGGLEGQGQHELAEVVAGVRQIESGTMCVCGQPVRLRSPRDAIRHKIVYVPPDRRTSGLMLPLSIKNNTAIAALGWMDRLGFVLGGQEKRRVLDVVRQLHLRYARLGQPVSDLSGGNQQKVLFARWLLVPSLQMLVLDDPTRGVDMGARAEVYALLRQLTDRGISVLLVSTDIMELIGLSDVIYVMYEGRITGSVDAREATEEGIMQLATGVEHAGTQSETG